MTLENGPDSPYQTWSTWRKTELRIVGSSMLSPTPDGKLHFTSHEDIKLPKYLNWLTCCVNVNFQFIVSLTAYAHHLRLFHINPHIEVSDDIDVMLQLLK